MDSATRWEEFTTRKEKEREERQRTRGEGDDQGTLLRAQQRRELLHWFDAECEVILEECAADAAHAAHAAHGPRPLTDAVDVLEKLSARIVWVGRRLSAQNTLLDPYDLRKAQRAVSDCERALAGLKKVLLPHKPFAFRNKAAYLDQVNKLVHRNTESTTELPTETRTHSADVVINNRRQEQISLQNNNGDDLQLVDLEACKVTIEGIVGALRISSLTGCHVRVGPVKTSIWVSSCSGCHFEFASAQLRVHYTSQSDFFVFAATCPIIEHCLSLRFGPLSLHYKGFKDYFQQTFPPQARNYFDSVKDFNWFKPTQSPNWSIVNGDQPK